MGQEEEKKARAVCSWPWVGELMKEYREKAEKANKLWGEEEEEGRGRVRRRLEQFGGLIGIVSCLFNEASSDTLMLMDVMATSRVDKVARETDLTSSQQEVEKESSGNWTRTL